VPVQQLTIVDAAPEHAEAIAAIYDTAARTSIATFDRVGHASEWWIAAMRALDPPAGHMLLVALDDRGAVSGYAKSGEHKARHAYRTTCETSVYVAAAARGHGVGAALYRELLDRLDRSPLRLAVGGVAEPNHPSTRLHLACGFERVGTFHGVGTKHGAARDVTWYERPLAQPAFVATVAGAADREDGMALIRSAYPEGATDLSLADELLLEWAIEVLPS
jgi:L-amino acid N-acyltransferase YncA